MVLCVMGVQVDLVFSSRLGLLGGACRGVDVEVFGENFHNQI